MQQARTLTEMRGAFRQVAENVLHHDHRGVHHQAEIDGANRQKIRRFAPRNTMSPIAKDSANGMVMPTMTALRMLPRNAHCSRKMSTIPAIMLCSTVRVVTRMRSLRS